MDVPVPTGDQQVNPGRVSVVLKLVLGCFGCVFWRTSGVSVFFVRNAASHKGAIWKGKSLPDVKATRLGRQCPVPFPWLPKGNERPDWNVE